MIFSGISPRTESPFRLASFGVEHLEEVADEDDVIKTAVTQTASIVARCRRPTLPPPLPPPLEIVDETGCRRLTSSYPVDDVGGGNVDGSPMQRPLQTLCVLQIAIC